MEKATYKKTSLVKYGQDLDIVRQVKTSPPSEVTTWVPVNEIAKILIQNGGLTFNEAMNFGLMKQV